MFRVRESSKLFLIPWLVTVAPLGLCACRSGIEAEVMYGGSIPAEVASSQDLTRKFLVQSLIGLNVDASASGLGFDLMVPQNVVSTTDEFHLVVSLGASSESRPLSLTFDSDEIESLERPAKFIFPSTMLLDSVAADGASLVVKDAKGIYSVIAPEAIDRSTDVVTVMTSQPLGVWSFTPATNSQIAPNYLAIAVSGLESYESLRYEVRFLRQRLQNSGYDVQIPDYVVFQKVTGNETRYVSAPANAIGEYAIKALEGPFDKDCSTSSGKGTLNSRVPLEIVCKNR